MLSRERGNHSAGANSARRRGTDVLLCPSPSANLAGAEKAHWARGRRGQNIRLLHREDRDILSSHQPSRPAAHLAGVPKVVILTTVMLTFISFWRAAALVLNDLASTAYYIPGIAEHAIGAAAPWFILMVMLFSTCVRAVYVESCSMFVRGGVYRIVKEAMGSTMAKVAVSALVFDFVLTGPISAVSAGHYVHSFIQSMSVQFHFPFPIDSNVFATILAVSVTAYFWWLNIKGVEESSDKALKIMMLTGVMVVLLLSWAGITILIRGASLPPFWSGIKLNAESLGWLDNVPWVKTFGLAVFFVCFGHTLLAMSGEEALAQVYREIEAPKQKNLLRAAFVVFVFSLVFTGFSSMACFMIIPEKVRHLAGDNMLNALVDNFAGPAMLKLGMTALVVAVGGLILAGAVNTSIFASNGVLNRVAEDGILADWFRTPHKKFGTTHHIINMVAVLQILTILVSRGEVTLLGEAYAFGVVWSFAFMSMSMFILRFKYKGERTLKVPLNPRIAGIEIPVGLGLVCSILLGVAVTNLFTKKVATVSGLCFTTFFFAIFVISDLLNRRSRKLAGGGPHKEKFILDRRTEISPEILEVPEGRKRILVPIRDPNNLAHLKAALEEAHAQQTELVVVTIKVDKTYRRDAEQVARNEQDKLFNEGVNLFTTDEELLFSRVVELAEKYGETIVPIVVPSNNSWFAIARTAMELKADEVLLGMSAKVPPDFQLAQLAMMWGMVSSGKDKEVTFRIIEGPGKETAATL